MEFLILPIFVLAGLFVLYTLSKHDFVLIRQNISLTQIFDLALTSAFFGFIAGRLFFIINAQDASLFHLIRFFHFVRFPGMSVLGFVIGAVLFLLIKLRKRKSLSRIFDVFALSFIPIYSFALLFRTYPVIFPFVKPIAFIILLILFIFFLNIHSKYKMKDGSIFVFLLGLLAIDTFIFQALSGETHKIIFNLSFAQLVSILILLVLIIIYFLRIRKK